MTDLPNSTSDGETPAGDPELAALVRPWENPTAPPAPSEGDASFSSEPGVDTVQVLPLAASAPDWEPEPRPRRRRSLVFRFGLSFVVGFVVAVGIGAGALYAWDRQYDGRVMPGVHLGSADLGGLTRDEAGAAIASAYGSLGNGQITLTGPDGQTTTMSYADVGRGPDTS